MNICAVVVLAIALVHPCVFSAPRVCPRCLRCDTIEVAYDDVASAEPSFIDNCNQAHFHLEHLRRTLYRCGSVVNGAVVNGCGETWTVIVPAPACACGWSPDHRVWEDPCVDGPYIDPEDPYNAQ